MEVKKLKEFRDRNIKVENEAFDRYMKNVSLLEETSKLQTEDSMGVELCNSVSIEQNSTMISEIKLRLCANPIQKENFKKRMHAIVDRGLEKLQRCDSNKGAGSGVDKREFAEKPTWEGWNPERASLISDLNEKLNKARNDEDLRSCLELRAQLADHHRTRAQAGPEDPISSKPVEEVASDDQKSRQVAMISPLISPEVSN